MVEARENDYSIITCEKGKTVKHEIFPMLVSTYVNYHDKQTRTLWEITKNYQVKLLNELVLQNNITRSTYRKQIQEIENIEDRWNNFGNYLMSQNETDLLVFSKIEYEKFRVKIPVCYKNAKLLDVACRMLSKKD